MRRFSAIIITGREQYGNASQPYSFSRTAKKALKEARETIASCINANPEQILFTSCGTESDNWVIKELALSHSVSWRVAVSEIEHHAILNPCKQLEGLGYKVDYLGVDDKGPKMFILFPEGSDFN